MRGIYRNRSYSALFLQLPQFAPAHILRGFRRIRIFFSLQPKIKPINILLVNFISMFRLLFLVKFVRIDKELDRLVQLPQRRNIAQRDDVLCFGSVQQ